MTKQVKFCWWKCCKILNEEENTTEDTTNQAKFYWWKNYKVWYVEGNTIEDIKNECKKLCKKYKAVQFEIL